MIGVSSMVDPRAPPLANLVRLEQLFAKSTVNKSKS